MLPDSKSGNMAKLCNHKRKIIPLVSIQCPPPDPNLKFQRGNNFLLIKKMLILVNEIFPVFLPLLFNFILIVKFFYNKMG